MKPLQTVRIVAECGNWFLLDVGNGQGRVLDLDNDRVFPPMSLVSLLAKGGWTVRDDA